MGRPKLAASEKAKRVTITMTPRAARMLKWLRGMASTNAARETHSGLLQRLIAKEVQRLGVSPADPMFDPPKEKK